MKHRFPIGAGTFVAALVGGILAFAAEPSNQGPDGTSQRRSGGGNQTTLLPKFLQQPPSGIRRKLLPPIEGNGGIRALEHHGAGGAAESIKTGIVLLPGANRPARLTFEVVDGMAVLEGDMILGSAAAIARDSAQQRSCRGEDCPKPKGRRPRPESYRWPGGVIPYRIDPRFDAEMRQRVTKAIARVVKQTRMILRPHRGERDYVLYRSRRSGCSAALSRRGGGQPINLSKGCTLGSSVHETLHAAGLIHEQARNDRDRYVRILWANIRARKAFNFRKRPSMAVDFGPYDYGSIMHYPSRGFGKRGPDGRPMLTIQVLRPGVRIGQRKGMTKYDISSVNDLVAQERCFDLPKASPRVLRHQGRVVLAGRQQWLADFGSRAAMAERAAAIMRAHRIDRVCLLGRGKAIKAQLLLRGGYVPEGGVRGEACDAIDAAGAKVRSVRGRWWVTQSRGGKLYGIAAFDTSTDALRAQDIIKNFRMRYVCHVGGLSKAFTYFRR